MKLVWIIQWPFMLLQWLTIPSCCHVSLYFCKIRDWYLLYMYGVEWSMVQVELLFHQSHSCAIGFAIINSNMWMGRLCPLCG